MKMAKDADLKCARCSSKFLKKKFEPTKLARVATTSLPPEVKIHVASNYVCSTCYHQLKKMATPVDPKKRPTPDTPSSAQPTPMHQLHGSTEDADLKCACCSSKFLKKKFEPTKLARVATTSLPPEVKINVAGNYVCSTCYHQLKKMATPVGPKKRPTPDTPSSAQPTPKRRKHPKERARKAFEMSKYERMLHQLYEMEAGRKALYTFLAKKLRKEKRELRKSPLSSSAKLTKDSITHDQ